MAATLGGANRIAQTRYIEGAHGGLVQVHDAALSTEDYWQSLLHDGTLFRFTAADSDLDVSESPTVYLLRAGGVDDGVHIRIRSSATQATQLLLYEAPRVTALGTPQTIVASNRNVGGTPTAFRVYLTPTTTNDGTLIESVVFGANTGASKFGGQADVGEFVLRKDTDYLLKVSSLADNNNIVVSVSVALHEDGTAPTTTTTTT
jgi:hypothetical protein